MRSQNLQQKEIVISKRAGNIAMLLAAAGSVVEWLFGVNWLFTDIMHATVVIVLMFVLYIAGVAIDAAINKEDGK